MLVVTTFVQLPAATVCEITYVPGLAKVIEGLAELTVEMVTPVDGDADQVCVTPAVPVWLN